MHIRFRNDYVMPLATDNSSSHKNSEVQIPICQGEETFFLFVLQTTWRSLIATKSYTYLERGLVSPCLFGAEAILHDLENQKAETIADSERILKVLFDTIVVVCSHSFLFYFIFLTPI